MTVKNRATSFATMAADRLASPNRSRAYGRDRTARLMTTRHTPTPEPTKHRPQNAHIPGSVAFSVLGGQVLR